MSNSERDRWAVLAAAAQEGSRGAWLELALEIAPLLEEEAKYCLGCLDGARLAVEPSVQRMLDGLEYLLLGERSPELLDGLIARSVAREVVLVRGAR